MGKYKYITNRVLTNDQGELKGNIRVLVPKDSDTAQVEYVCPNCGNTQKTSRPWSRPFSIACSKCNFVIKLPKMKDEMKKEIKARSKK
jgi:DNA-directed RNA polymerase subunit RPC12/RpoP